MLIPAGYYTLTDLGVALNEQGIAVRISPDCGRDVYALRSSGVEWPALRAALIADGRLTIESDGRTWNVAWSSKSRNAERAALTRFTESLRDGVHRIYEPARKHALDLWFLPESARTDQLEKDREALAAEPDRRNAEASARYTLVSEALSERLYGAYSNLSIPAFLSSPERGFGKVWTATHLQAAALLVPGGDYRTYPMITSLVEAEGEPAAARRLGTWIQAGKLMIDPLTLTTRCRAPIWIPEFAKVLDQTDSADDDQEITPRRFALTAPPITQPLSRASFPQEVRMPQRSLTASEALLRWSEGNGTNLVAYVAPLGDVPLRASPALSPDTIVRMANAGEVDPTELQTATREWTGLDGHSYARSGRIAPQLRTLPGLSLSRVGGFAVVRTEAGFLDGLVAEGLGLPTAWANRRLRDEGPSLREVVDLVARLKPGRWKNGLCPWGVLQWTNPISLYPFAAMLSADPPLRDRLAALKPGEKWVAPLSTLPRASTFRTALLAAAPFHDAVLDQQLDPLVLPYALRSTNSALEVEAVRDQAGTLRLKLAAPKVNPSGSRKLLWSSWVRVER